MPFPGVIESLRVPSGPGIRFDTGVAAGSTVPDQFDSMLAKLVVSAPTREECLLRARRALAELDIQGVPTVKAFDQAVLAYPDFAAADGHLGVYTRWIEEEFLPSVDVQTLSGGDSGPRAAQHKPIETWIELDGKRMRLGLPALLAGVVALGAGIGGLANAASTGTGAVSAGTVASNVSPAGPANTLAALAAVLGTTGNGSAGPDFGAPAANAIAATITGTVVRWLADDGAQVSAGQPVVVLEAMKMETEVAAPAAGTLHHGVQVGDAVRFNQELGTVQ